MDEQLDLIKDNSKTIGLWTIVLSQVNRGPEERDWELGERRPRSSDNKESGAIEQYADSIIGCYRDVVYDPSHEDYKGQVSRLMYRLVENARAMGAPVGRFLRELAELARGCDQARYADLAEISPLGTTEIEEYCRAWRKITACELIITDNRHGDTGTVHGRFEGRYYRVQPTRSQDQDQTT